MKKPCAIVGCVNLPIDRRGPVFVHTTVGVEPKTQLRRLFVCSRHWEAIFSVTDGKFPPLAHQKEPDA